MRSGNGLVRNKRQAITWTNDDQVQDANLLIYHENVIMDIFSALVVICAGNSPVPGEFAAQRPVTRSFDVFFDLYMNKRLSKQPWSRWFETLPRPLWRHSNVVSGDYSISFLEPT